MLKSERGISEPDEDVEEMVQAPSRCTSGVGCQSTQCRHRLDEFHVPDIFKEWARVNEDSPSLLEGSVPRGLAFEEAQCARDNNDDARNCRAWKLFMLFPRMLLAGHLEAVKSPRSCWRNDSRCSVLAGGRNWSDSLELTATGAQPPFGGGDGTAGMTSRGERIEQ